MRILLVEDSARLRGLVAEVLGDAGYRVVACGSAGEFEAAARLDPFDLYIIDLGLPDDDGVGLILRLRQAQISVPILVVTGRSSMEDRVRGLDSGADDYLVKPFNNAELLARIRALLRRPANLIAREVKAGKLVLSVSTGEVKCGSERIDLTLGEHRLLRLFMRRLGQLVMRDDVDRALSDGGREITPNACEQAISRLRKTLAHWPTGVEVKTVRGFGYRLEEVAR